eukprot:TRINITY_DN21949_c0_g1_i1.p1 TRINITY_DN21949_c0_g1~~TRINITY_DN21949_c0_g1_i1.p1  ORF type:complete len:245 (+),score=56.86 TRINITY_DN21949_c0_g1_i1:1-735(+)
MKKKVKKFIHRDKARSSDNGEESKSVTIEPADKKQEQAQSVFEDKPLEIKQTDIILFPGGKLGQGAFKVVFKGTCYGTEVAISKLVKETLSAEQREELVNEMRIMKQKNHTNLVSFLGYCKRGDDFEIISELCDGSLQDLMIQKKCNLSPYERLSLLRDAAKGLAWLHGGNPIILHRDVKLPNILYRKIDGNYIAKITDFGLSQIRPDHSVKEKFTDPSKRGTATHSPPEVLHGGRHDPLNLSI